MHCLKSLLGLLFIALLPLAAAPATRAANPIITTAFSADPSAHVFGGRMYVYPSHDRADAQEFDMTDYHVYSTDDMANWQDHGVILSLAQIPWAKGHLWAPDCNYFRGKYYLYFPADDNGKYDFRIGVAVSRSPAGPFVAEARPIPGASGIDPSIFRDDDGTLYLIWAGGGPVLCKLAPDMKTLAGKPIHVQGCDKFFEGPWLFKRNGLYYLTYPAFQKGGSGLGGNGQNYDYATAKTISGPYAYRGTFTRTDAAQPGAGNIHGSQVEWHGQWYCFYHDFSLSSGDPKSGFKRCVRADLMRFGPDGAIAPLQWTQAGPPKIKNLDPFVRCEAVCLSQSPSPLTPHAVTTEACREGGMDLGSLSDTGWVRYVNADFGHGAKSFTARVATPVGGSRIELHRDRLDGPLLGVCPVPDTGGWQTWRTVTWPVTRASGVHDVFFRFRGSGTGGLFNLSQFRFIQAVPPRRSRGRVGERGHGGGGFVGYTGIGRDGMAAASSAI